MMCDCDGEDHDQPAPPDCQHDCLPDDDDDGWAISPDASDSLWDTSPETPK
jgi:hypothetical protein